MTDDLSYDPTLVTWLRAQLDADEEMLQGSGDLGWLTFRDLNGEMRYTTAAAAGPDDLWLVDGNERADYAAAQVVHREKERLADIRAKRKLIHELTQQVEASPYLRPEGLIRLLILLAQPYADREGFRDEWRA